MVVSKISTYEDSTYSPFSTFMCQSFKHKFLKFSQNNLNFMSTNKERWETTTMKWTRSQKKMLKRRWFVTTENVEVKILGQSHRNLSDVLTDQQTFEDDFAYPCSSFIQLKPLIIVLVVMITKYYIGSGFFRCIPTSGIARS